MKYFYIILSFFICLSCYSQDKQSYFSFHSSANILFEIEGNKAEVSINGKKISGQIAKNEINEGFYDFVNNNTSFFIFSKDDENTITIANQRYEIEGASEKAIELLKIKSIILPFSLEDYLNIYYENQEKYHFIYPSYQINKYIENELSTLDYEGEEYKCFILPSRKNGVLIMLVWILRGDSEYYLLLTLENNKITNHLEVAHTGGESPIFCNIDGDYMITKYKRVNNYKRIINLFQILPNGTITELK